MRMKDYGVSRVRHDVRMRCKVGLGVCCEGQEVWDESVGPQW